MKLIDFSLFPFLNDFYSYYIAGNLIQKNLAIYGVGEAFRTFVEHNHFQFTWGTGYSYPPFLAILMIPLSSLPFFGAGMLWTIMQILLYVLLAKKLSLKRKSALPFLLFFGPALGSIANGQVNVITLWCLYFYLYSKNEVAQVLGICVAGWVKVFPFVLLVKDVLQKKSKFFFLLIPFFMLFFLFQCIPSSGQYMIEYFFKVLPGLQSSYDPYITNQALVGFISRLVGDSFNPLFVTGIEGVVFLSLVIFTLRQKSKNREEIDLLWLLTILLTAGKNSYWNMLPTVFIFVFLMHNFSHLNSLGKKLTQFSALCNVIFPIILIAFMQFPILLKTPVGGIFSSLGFLSLVLLYYPLIHITSIHARESK